MKMRLLNRAPRPRAKTFRPAERYLMAAADDARRLGHRHVGTEHLLHGLIRNPNGSATQILERLGAGPDAVDQALQCWRVRGTPTIDPHALATLGIDFDSVRDRLEQTFGPGALERTHAACLGICPRAKIALAFAVDHANGHPVGDDHLLLGMLSVPDCVAARVLADVGVTLEGAEAILRNSPRI
jgi:ATP-dependent Clp protease ATP-binding subunit ClpA